MRPHLAVLTCLLLATACTDPADPAKDDTGDGDTAAESGGGDGSGSGSDDSGDDTGDDIDDIHDSLGAANVFAGNSFFVPVAAAFDAAATGGEIEGHELNAFFAPSADGTPQSLWETPASRSEVEALLGADDVDVFGLTIGDVDPDNPAEYDGLWFDLARDHHPDVTLMIGHPYLEGGPRSTPADFEAAITAGGESMFSLVQALRASLPDNDVVFVQYGLVLSEMMEDFAAGELEDIDGMLPVGGVQPDRALFIDGSPGHAGPMAEHICGLVWLHAMFGVDIEPYIDPNYDAEDVARIANEVIAANERYRLPAD